VGIVTTALLRPETYLGHAREAVNLVRAAARYPKGVFEAAISCASVGDELHDTPVVLVHGYGHNRSGWFVLEGHLRRAGFTNIHTVNYNPLRHDVPELAARLAERIELIRTLTGAPKVHLVGHSLGGIVVRWYVQELGGDRCVETAITIASPHHGTATAFAGLPLGATARELIPGSWVVNRLHAGAKPTTVRWIAYYSNLDLLVQPANSATISEPALSATNVLVKDQGHLSIMLSPVLARSIVAQLEHAESRTDAGAAPAA
jgi:pimeloyl-ACP methyl ester carboxylesterase